ncbi:MAG TPA: outer membrane lipoprotein-sorting protein [Thermoanaerobaculia bacterium]|nr:outer membrane lipoprotein-sorting protein [Thermoanaerobaculia bacterium]
MRFLRALAVLALVAAPAAAETLDEVLAQHFAALGGKDKLAAVQSAKLVAKQVFGPQEVPVTIQWKRPDKVRLEFTVQGMTGIQAYDGTTAWMVMPFLGKNDPEEMTGDDLKDIIEQADMIDGPLFDWQAKGHTVELLGEDTIEGTPAWKLRLTRKNGDVSTVWFDKDAYVQIKSEGKRKRGDQEIELETSFGDYKEVGGLYFPHSIESKPKGAPQGATITVESIELDAELDDALFAMPPKPAAPATGSEG